MKNSNIITEKDAYIRSKRDKKPNKLIFDDLNEKYSINNKYSLVNDKLIRNELEVAPMERFFAIIYNIDNR